MTYLQNSLFIDLITGDYPLAEGDIRLRHPEITEEQTWPNFPLPEKYAVVPYSEPPTHNPSTQIVYQVAPIQVGGQWVAQWAVRDFTEQELADIAKLEEEIQAANFPSTEVTVSVSDNTSPSAAVTPINP